VRWDSCCQRSVAAGHSVMACFVVSLGWVEGQKVKNGFTGW
jgi:hypothetical protein